MIQKINPLSPAFRGLKFKQDAATQDIINRKIPYTTSVYAGAHFAIMKRDYVIKENPYIKNNLEQLDKASDALGYDIELSAKTNKPDDFLDTDYSLRGEKITLSAKITSKTSETSREKKCVLPAHTTETDTPYIAALPDFIKEILFTMVNGK